MLQRSSETGKLMHSEDKVNVNAALKYDTIKLIYRMNSYPNRVYG